jgi:Eco57I restriction-modification methylase
LSSQALSARPRRFVEKLAARKNPNEAQTEDDLVYPVLERLGWAEREVQPNASVKARLDVPDALLYPDAAAKAAAGPLDPWQRFAHGAAIVEAKRWGRPLDREERGRKGEEGTPSSQMLRYLRRIEERTKGKLRWGVLTNGRFWRLYFHGATSIAEDFLEIDLAKALDIATADGPGPFDKRPDLFADDRAWRDHVLRLFLLLFGREAFLPGEQGETFHQLALREGKRWEEKVRDSLSETVFRQVFPDLANAIAARDPNRPKELAPAYLEEVRQGALILLYRLLFVLYAEDRNLLPDERGPYASYCLTKLRQEIAEKSPQSFLPGLTLLWSRLSTIFMAIAEGNDALGIPPYNGGLFDRNTAPILSRVQLHDDVIARIIFALSHEPDKGDGRGPRYINYRDLSVQQLGAVYEGILEYGLRVGDGGKVEIDADDAARHTSGSYYTPDDLVTLIIERAVGPLVAEKIAAFRTRAAELKSDRRPVAERLAELEKLDPASAILTLKICDPSMGSGHFLVSLVDWIADAVLDAQEEAAKLVEFDTYVTPLAARVAEVREKILGQARQRGWPIVEAQLDDRHVVRRMVLKRVVYGVDKNPMAVELAKVALWLHSFTVGAPLSFLDHHLRSGDSVIGAFVRPTVDALQKRGALFNLGQIARVEQVAGLMAEIEATTDNDVAEVSASKAKFATVEDAIEPVAALFSILTAERAMGIFNAEPKRSPKPIAPLLAAGAKSADIERARRDWKALDRSTTLQSVFENAFGDYASIATGMRIATESDTAAANAEPHIVAPPEGQSLDLAADLALPERERIAKRNSRAEIRRRLVAQGLIDELQKFAGRERFLHWEIAFPNVWQRLASAEPEGGFDAVIGNPPYVRQELLGDEVKRALKSGYASYSGMADLYVYFYEQGLRLLRPGGRMSYVVTNKWLKAGYAEELRALFADKAWLEFVADFGHAKHFFPDADVFPSVLVMRRPTRSEAAPEETKVCVIPRDLVPRKGLSAAVEEATFPLPRAMFTRQAWVLEPKPVMDLLDKIRRNGVPLAEYAGVKPLYGIKTGLNEAFLIDTAKRDELVRADPKSADIIKPYLRGQDIERWHSPDSKLFMIVMRSSGNYAWPWANVGDEQQAEVLFARTYPALHAHMKRFEDTGRDPKTGKPTGLRYREDQGRYWWELRACDYYDAFERPKITYQVIQFYPSYSLDRFGRFGNDKTFFFPVDNPALVAILNAPIMWWHNWRFLPHLKDEALSPMGFKMEQLPIAPLENAARHAAQTDVDRVVAITQQVGTANAAILDWLRHEFGLDKPGAALGQPHALDADGFAAAVRKALPRARKLSAADIARLKQEHRDTLEPAARAANEALALERKLSDLVNAAYGLTPEEVKLMWDTAPPRMPFSP